MERDFMGLSSKQPLIVVKEEVNNDVCQEIGFTEGSGVQWAFSNKVTAVPQLMSFKVAQEDKTKKTLSDPLGSSGSIPFWAAQAYEHNPRHSTADVQKSFNLDRQGGTHSSAATYSVQHDARPRSHFHDVKTFPVSNQTISLPINNPLFMNHSASIGLNVGGAIVKQQLLGGIPVTAPHSALPTGGSVCGVTEPWNNVKPCGSPQLTIFYAGTVNVYEDVSPEKAQAIMFLAGSGTSGFPTLVQPKVQVQAPSSRPTTIDRASMNQPVKSAPYNGLSSPISVSSQTGAQSGSVSNNAEEPLAAKSTVVATTPIRELGPPKMVNAVGSVAATAVVSAGCSNFYVGIPQARKASLALFLEKRKQRATNAAPYTINIKSTEGSVPESSCFNLSATSAVVPATGAPGTKLEGQISS